MKKVFLIVLCIAAVLSVSACTKFTVIDDSDTSVYDEMAAENDVMPKTDELGEYVELSTNRNENIYFVYISETYMLTAKYDENEYESQKARVKENYRFGDDEFELDGFRFRVLSSEYIDYPHTMYFIGLNDTDRAISYVYFFDSDLDVIDQPYDEFLKENCNWKYECQTKDNET